MSMCVRGKEEIEILVDGCVFLLHYYTSAIYILIFFDRAGYLILFITDLTSDLDIITIGRKRGKESSVKGSRKSKQQNIKEF